MSAQGAVLAGRRAAERLMIDTCTIREPGSSGPLNTATGNRPVVPGTQRYSGKCKVQTYEPYESVRSSGEHVYTEQRYQVHVPVGTPVVIGDEITITAAALDAGMVALKFRVAGTGPTKTYATAYRLLCDIITDP